MQHESVAAVPMPPVPPMRFADWTHEREQRFLDQIESALRLADSLDPISNLDTKVSTLLSVYDLVTQCRRVEAAAAKTTSPSFPNAQICRIWHATAQNYTNNRARLYSYMYNPPGIPGIPHVDPQQLHDLDTHFFVPFVIGNPIHNPQLSTFALN